MKFAWIQTEKAYYPVRKLCAWLSVTPSGFYAWCKRPESARARRDRHLKVLVHASFDASKQRYGSPRIHEDLREQQERVSRKRVIRLMQEEQLQARVRKLCQWLAVTPSGFYAWCQRPASARTKRDRHLKVLVQASFDASKRRYGSPRIHEDLLEQDERVSRKRVIRLMQAEGLKARVRKRFKCTTMSDHDLPVAANLLNRQFTAEAPNQRWVGDTTEFVIG